MALNEGMFLKRIENSNLLEPISDWIITGEKKIFSVWNEWFKI